MYELLGSGQYNLLSEQFTLLFCKDSLHRLCKQKNPDKDQDNKHASEEKDAPIEEDDKQGGDATPTESDYESD